MDEGQRPIYLDMQATTPVDPRVLDAMMPFYVGVYGNPHSRTHAYGWESEKAVEDAPYRVYSTAAAIFRMRASRSHISLFRTTVSLEWRIWRPLSDPRLP
ncbi:hypothetical protein LB505_009192 [Fusarium chuoi]|nr:hypothetical protein LB505_009192 [Fusarium chuoi]